MHFLSSCRIKNPFEKRVISGLFILPEGEKTFILPEGEKNFIRSPVGDLKSFIASLAGRIVGPMRGSEKKF